MDVQIFDKPSTHIVIDNFLPDNLATDCLNEAITLKDKYKINDVTLPHYDDCEQCKKEAEIYRKRRRLTDVCQLDEIFKGKRQDSIIISTLQYKLFQDPDFLQLLRQLPLPFNMLDSFTCMDQVLSRFGKCEFYNWHQDRYPDQKADRLVTCVYYVNKEPQKFKGGNLFFSGKELDQINYKTIEPKHNRLIMFTSVDWHEVETVTLSENFDESRFSVNVFLGYFTERNRWGMDIV